MNDPSGEDLASFVGSKLLPFILTPCPYIAGNAGGATIGTQCNMDKNIIFQSLFSPNSPNY
jgi:hypothetical protein